MGSKVFGVGEPHVAHGTVVGLDSSVAYQMVLKLVPAVENTAANLKENKGFFSQLEKKVTFQADNNSNLKSPFLLKYNSTENQFQIHTDN